MEYLNGYLAILPEDQRKVIIDRLVLSSGEASELSKALIAKLSSLPNEPLTTFREQNGRTNSADYNAIVGEVFGDLNILFNESETLNNVISTHHYSNISTLTELKQEIKKLEERIQSISAVAQSEDTLIIKQEKFSNLSNLESRNDNENLFTDRDGTIINSDASIDPHANNSTLSASLSNNNGITIKLVTQTSRGIAPETSHRIEKAIDNSIETFWGEVALTDQQLNVTIDGVSGGAIAKFEVEFEKATLINEVALTPFGFYPLEVCSVKYLMDTSSYSTPTTVNVGKMDPISKKTTYRFPGIVAKKLIFVVKQKNYVINNYLISKEAKDKADVWASIAEAEEMATIGINRRITVARGPNGEFPEVRTPINKENRTVAQQVLDKLSGWDIYLQKWAQYELAYDKYVKDLEVYNATYNTSYKPEEKKVRT